MLFTPRTLCLRHLDQKQHLQRSSWKCYTANSPRLLKLDDGSHQGADLACRFGLEETNVLMVHICNQRGIQVYCSIQTCQYLYRFYFRMLAAPPQSIEQIHSHVAIHQFLQPRHLIDHLLQALHHIVDGNSDTHVVLQK